MYPIYYQNIVDHRFGHGLLLFALVLPIILFFVVSTEQTFDVLVSNCFLSFCECLALTSLFGKLQVFGHHECWKIWNSLLVIILLFLAQLLVNFQLACISPERARQIAVALGVVRVLMVIWFGSPHFAEIYESLKVHTARKLDTSKYQCLMLQVLVFAYLLARVLVNAYFSITTPPSVAQVINVRISLLMLCAVGGAVLPGRMVRRGVISLKVS